MIKMSYVKIGNYKIANENIKGKDSTLNYYSLWQTLYNSESYILECMKLKQIIFTMV